MRAALLKEYKAPLAVQEAPDPTPGNGEVVIKVEASGVCHSDLHIAEGELEHFKPFVKIPVILGHEIVGKVVVVGPEVRRLREGDRVGVPWIYSSCDACEYCLSGREMLCSQQVITGAMVDGGYAERVKAKASHVTRIPDSLSAIEAAPLFCAGVTVYKGMRTAGVSLGQRVGVFGIGGLGHLAVQLSHLSGAKVYAVDISPEKAAFALECGADEAIDASKKDAASALQRAGGLDVALVTSASVAAYQTAFLSLRRGGTLVMYGIPGENLSLVPLLLIAAEVKIIASAVGSRQEIREVLQLAADGKVKCRTTARKLDEVNTVFDEMKRGAILGRAVLTFD